MNKFVCNYAIARFRPYRETGEFVNVGVVLLCPQVDFFGHRFQQNEHKRIADFFPELDFTIFQAGLDGLLQELERITIQTDVKRQFITDAEAQARVGAFKELVRPRESLFHFSEVGTVLSEDPGAKLDELFDSYVKRQFVRARECQEIIVHDR